MVTTAISDRFRQVQEEITKAAVDCGRSPEEVRLVTVTKGHSLEAVREVVAAGARCLGENYVEEAEPKILALSEQDRVEWHMIGHVQSRKAEAVCSLFQIVHSLDRIKLARRLQRFAGEGGQALPVLLECNVSGEESKYGWPAWREEDWPDLLPDFAEILQLKKLRVQGLMTMAPFDPDPENARPYFLRLRRLQEFLENQLPSGEWRELSMGMSADFGVAIQEGATLVRIGTAIMGPRPTD